MQFHLRCDRGGCNEKKHYLRVSADRWLKLSAAVAASVRLHGSLGSQFRRSSIGWRSRSVSDLIGRIGRIRHRGLVARRGRASRLRTRFFEFERTFENLAYWASTALELLRASLNSRASNRFHPYVRLDAFSSVEVRWIEAAGFVGCRRRRDGICRLSHDERRSSTALTWLRD